MKPQNPELSALGSKLETRVPAGVESKLVDAKVRFELTKSTDVEAFLLKWAKACSVWGKGAVWSIKFFDVSASVAAPTSPDGKVYDVTARFEIYKDANVPDAIRYWVANKTEAEVIAAAVISVNVINQDGLPKSSAQWLEGLVVPPEGSFVDRIPVLEEIKSVFVDATKRV